jgi:hypothetical protein
MGGRLKFGPASRQKRTPTIKMLPSQLESSEPLSGCEGVVDASAGACDSRSLLLRNKQKGKNSFAVTLLRANLEACAARRRRPNVFTWTRFSSQSQQKDGSVGPYSTNSSGLAVVLCTKSQIYPGRFTGLVLDKSSLGDTSNGCPRQTLRTPCVCDFFLIFLLIKTRWQK